MLAEMLYNLTKILVTVDVVGPRIEKLLTQVVRIGLSLKVELGGSSEIA